MFSMAVKSWHINLSHGPLSPRRDWSYGDKTSPQTLREYHNMRRKFPQNFYYEHLWHMNMKHEYPTRGLIRVSRIDHQGPLLLTPINFNLNMNK